MNVAYLAHQAERTPTPAEHRLSAVRAGEFAESLAFLRSSLGRPLQALRRPLPLRGRHAESNQRLRAAA